ncbi:hypothetical protein EV561_12851 [Rhizobium sp. BK376]|nr:hypothetical protein EV561_12851 [Rhizobium sp. BK376]
MVCVAPLVDDAEVRQFPTDAAVGAVALVERRFCNGISTGEIPSNFSVTTRGPTMHTQLGAPRKTLLRDAEEAAELVFPPRFKGRVRDGKDMTR